MKRQIIDYLFKLDGTVEQTTREIETEETAALPTTEERLAALESAMLEVIGNV